jgi:hypothetical protein
MSVDVEDDMTENGRIDVELKPLADKMRELALAHPDNIYARPVGVGNCSYVAGHCSDGSCGCIVGQAAKELGLSNQVLAWWDNRGGIDTVIADGKYIRFGNLDSKEERLLVNWVTQVQRYQDTGDTWGIALANADRSYSAACQN